MPYYIFSNPNNSNEIKQIYQKMTDEHVYFDESGLKWDRVWQSPQASIDTKWDANSSNDWLDKTSKKKGTLGNLQDKSWELSAAREKQFGIDKIKENYKKNWSKARNGKKCPDHIFNHGKKSKTEEVLEV